MLPIPGVSNELNELVIAIRQGNLNTASNLIGNNPLPEGGYSLLYIAIEYKQSEIAKLLMSKGANVNDEFQNHTNTPLHFAVMNRDIEIVRILLNHKANVDTEGQDGKTVLHLAVEQGDSLMVQQILSHRPDINNDSNKDSLKVAVNRCQESSDDIVESLVRYGFTLHPEDACYSKLWRAVIGKMSSKSIGNILRFHFSLYRWARTFSVDLSIVKKQLKEIIEILWERDYHITEIYECKRKRSVRDVAFANQQPLSTDDTNAIFRILRLIKTLFESGSAVSAKTETGLLLRLAVQNKDKDISQIVAEYCPDVNLKIENGKTLLHFLAKAGGGDVCTLIIKRGADVNAKDENGCTPLYLAVLSRHQYTVEILLKNGADVNLTNESGFTALHVAALCQCKDFVRILLAHGADVNLTAEKDVTPLHVGMMAGTEEVCRLLVESGANVNTVTTYGLTALHVAVLCNRPGIIQTLLDSGADINFRDKVGYTALPLGILKSQFYTTVKRINNTSNGYFIKVNSEEAFNESGFTALHLAIRCEHEDIMQILLERGADVNLTSRTGVTALHLAAVEGLTKVFRSLVDRGAYVNAQTEDGLTALHVAALFGRSCMMKILLDSVADIDAVDKKGNTALHFAVLAKQRSAFQILVGNGCDVHIANKYCQTAFRLIRPNYDDRRLISSFENCFCLYPIHEDERKRYSDDMFYRRYINYYPCAYGCCPSVDECVITVIYLNEYQRKMKIDDLYAPIVYLKFPNTRTWEAYEDNVKRMKRTEIGNTNVTFYDVVTKPVEQIAAHLRKQDIVIQLLELNDYQREFPVYAYLIKICFERIKKFMELLDKSEKCVRRLISADLSRNDTEKILSYLSKADLITLTKICPNINVVP